MAVVLCCPGLGFAIGLGEAEIQSKLGEPLLMRVGLTVNAGEKVDKSCLTLTIPDPVDENARDYFSRVRMAIRTDGDRQYVNISSSLPFDELFAIVRLQIKCPGIGNLSKTFTILPDLDFHPAIAPASEQVVMPATVPVVAVASAPVPTEVVRNATESPAVMPTMPSVHRRIPGKARSAKPIDESRIGKISPEERKLLLALQKLLDTADDQTAKYLELQHRVKLLEDEFGLIKFKLKIMELGSSASAPSGRQTRPESQTISGEKTATPLKLPAWAQQASRNMQPGLLIGAGFLLAVLALWQGLRYYTRLKSRQAVQPVINEPADIYEASGINLPPTTSSTPEPEEIYAQPPSRGAPPAIKETPPPSMTTKSKEELAADDSMLEEAELYATHGHSNKAVEILREIISQSPGYSEAWVLLFSILSSLGMADAFEQAAREFLKHNPQSDSWKMIQALGRTLDQNNPLYAGDKNLDVAARFLQQLALNKKRLVGDILVEMGALSEQDLLNCMAGFDPKQHGRFGGYLVSRNMITHKQLNEALLHQQEIGQDLVSSTRLTLQDMDNFLSDFDPERDESIGKYLVSHGVITPEQLNKVLHQQYPEAEPDGPVSELYELAAASGRDDIEHLLDLMPVRDKLTRTGEIDPGSETVKVVKQGDQPVPAVLFPEIDFDIGSVIPKKPDNHI